MKTYNAILALALFAASVASSPSPSTCLAAGSPCNVTSPVDYCCPGLTCESIVRDPFGNPPTVRI